MDVFLVRHTRVAVAPGMCYGRLDVPLADSFEEELNGLRPLLPEFDRIYSIPSLRCRRLAETFHSPLLEFDDR